MKNITILGAGLMGHGLAQIFASAGHEVMVFDPETASLNTLKTRIGANLTGLGQTHECLFRITGTADLHVACANADLVIEAAPENLAMKQSLFAKVEAIVRPETILASNTSVIPITDIMGNLTHKARALGTHFWNPPFLVPLVEIIGTNWTSPETIEAVTTLLQAAGKTTVHVKKDVPGFIGNRLQNALWREAIWLVESGICTAEDVDIVVKASFGRRLAVLGPMENMDLIGTDLTLAIHNIVMPALDARPKASPYLESLVAEGKLGMKSGEGLRHWTEAEKAETRARLFNELKRQASE